MANKGRQPRSGSSASSTNKGSGPARKPATDGQSAAAKAPRTPAASGTTPGGSAPGGSAASRTSVRPRSSNNVRKRRRPATPWERLMQTRGLPIYATIALVIVVVGVFWYMSQHQGTPTTTRQNAQPIVNAVAGITPQTFASVGTGGVSQPLKAIPNTPLLKDSSGKPEVFYLGAEYCPFCAAERWSVVAALSRFGTFHNLSLTTSSSSDVYADTSTFTFYGSTYTSQYVSFVPVETSTRDQNTPLQTPTAEQQQLVNTYDSAQYVGQNSAGSIPFIDFGNQYITSGASYSPQVLRAGPSPTDDPLSAQDIAKALSNPQSPITQNIVGSANYMTAAICKMTNNQPANVCTAAPIPQLEQQLP
jgi:hypothetical protein